MRTEHILLVDDEQGILDMLTITLKKEGFTHITTATNGSDALKAVQSHTFNVIVLIMLKNNLVNR